MKGKNTPGGGKQCSEGKRKPSGAKVRVQGESALFAHRRQHPVLPRQLLGLPLDPVLQHVPPHGHQPLLHHVFRGEVLLAATLLALPSLPVGQIAAHVHLDNRDNIS